MRKYDFKIFFFVITIFASIAYAQNGDLTVSGTITTTNGPSQGKSGVPLTLTGEGLDDPITGTSQAGGDFDLNGFITTAIQDNTYVPLKFDMGNFPNPFNPHTTVYFQLPNAEDVIIDIYDVKGSRVKTLVNDRMNAGRHEIQWDATTDAGMNVAEGIYLYRLRTSSYTKSGKMVYMHGAPSSRGRGGQSHTSSSESGNFDVQVNTMGTEGIVNGDSLDMVLDLGETDSTEAGQISFKVHENGGTYTINPTVDWKNFPPKVINQQGDITALEDHIATSSPTDSLFYDFNGHDELDFTIDGLSANVTASYNSQTKRIEFNPASNYFGTHSGVTITASDGQDSVSTDPFNVTFDPDNDAPQFTNPFPLLELDRGDSTYVNLIASDVDNALASLLFSANYDTSKLKVTIDQNTDQALVKAIGSGNHNILWRVTDPPGLYDEANQGVNITYVAMVNAVVRALVTDNVLPGIVVKVDGTPYTSDGQGNVVLPLRNGQRHEVTVDSNATTWGWTRGITYNRLEDGTLDEEILLLGIDAPYKMFRATDEASLPGDTTNRYQNWMYQSLNRTYILVNPPSPAFEDSAKQKLMDDFDQLDLKGRQTFTWLQTIFDTTTPEDSLEKVYSYGNYADVAVIWKDTGGPSGLNYVKLDSSGKAHWGTVFMNKIIQYPDNYGYWTLKSEMFSAGGPNTTDADPIQFPQFQLCFFATDPPGLNDMYHEWGNPNNPYATIHYFGQDLPIEPLQETMNIDLWLMYGNNIKWNPNKMRIPNIIIN